MFMKSYLQVVECRQRYPIALPQWEQTKVVEKNTCGMTESLDHLKAVGLRTRSAQAQNHGAFRLEIILQVKHRQLRYMLQNLEFYSVEIFTKKSSPSQQSRRNPILYRL